MASQSGDVGPVNGARRTTIRNVTAVLTFVVSALYVAVFFVQLPHIRETDNPAPAYLALAVGYAIAAILLARRDNRSVQWAGAGVQVVLLGLFFWILVGLYRHGDELFILNMLGLVVPIIAVQVVLLVLLSYLAATAA